MKKILLSSFLAMGLVGCAAGPQPLYNWELILIKPI